MASESNLPDPESSPSTTNELDENQIRRLSLLLPILFSLASRQQNAESNDSASERHDRRVRVIIVNPVSETMIVIDGSADLESMFQELLSGKSGVSPATKASIEAMPRVVVTEEGTDCSICLEDYEVGGEAREMPCKHRFHSGCIEKWLGIHGSCPICRFLMPVEEENKSSAAADDSEQGDVTSTTENLGGVISVSMWVRSRGGGDDPMDEDPDFNLIPDDPNLNSDSDSQDEYYSAIDESPQDMES